MIGERAFYECYSLTSITIPTSVTKFGCGCFYNSGITEENHPELPDDCFENPVDISEEYEEYEISEEPEE